MKDEYQEKYQVNYDNFLNTIQKNVFGFHRIKKETILAQYHRLSDDIKKANDISYMSFCEMLGDENTEKLENTIPAESTKELINNIVEEYVLREYKTKSYAVDGVCLRENLLHCAVHMKYNIEMLGFISELIDGDNRFVYVDFGDKSGAVKIDVEELIIAERL